MSISANDDKIVICPYNKNHIIYLSRIHSHLIKCEEKYPPLAICKFNAIHRVPFEELETHLRNCPDKIVKTTLPNVVRYAEDENKKYCNDMDECWD